VVCFLFSYVLFAKSVHIQTVSCTVNLVVFCSVNLFSVMSEMLCQRVVCFAIPAVKDLIIVIALMQVLDSSKSQQISQPLET
jgi:hypothetical protein